MQNVRVTMEIENASEHLKRVTVRVIDGKLLNAVNDEGKFQEAKGIYLQMMGIKIPGHELRCSFTDEAPTVIEPIAVSELGSYQKVLERNHAKQQAEVLAEALATALIAKERAAKELDKSTASVTGTGTPAEEPKKKQRLSL